MDEEMRKRFFALFEYPYFQFTLVDDGSRSAHLPPISAAYVVETSNISLLRQLAKVYEFKLHSRTEEELSSLLRVLYLKARLTNLRMKRLMIVEGHKLSQLPVFQGLESLHLLYFRQLKAAGLQLSLYTSLRFLTLESCAGIEDVTCLDGIYDLRLMFCHNIRDISCLNNNRRVTVWGCSGISDYSKSFKHTKRLSLLTNSNRSEISLNCESLKFLWTEGFYINLSNLSSLLFLSLERITGFYSLPPNKLQKVRISDCIDFHSFENMENIQTVELKCLQSVFTLQGLGQNNRVVRLESMPNLDDISSLKDAKRVEICDCPRAVNTLNSLKNVQEIKLCSASLIYHCASHRVTDCFYQMKELTHLQELELTFQARITQVVMISGTFLTDLWRFIQSCPSIKKVVIHSESFRSTGLMGEQLIEAFMIDYSHPKQIVLLRKKVA